MNHVESTGFSFDGKRLQDEFNVFHRKYVDRFRNGTAVSLRKRAGDDDLTALTYGAGPLVGADGKYFESESSFTEYNGLIAGSYTHDVIIRVEEYAAGRGLKIGRAGYRILPPRMCLDWHVDYDNAIRYHIPIITSPACFFVHEEVVSKMPSVGGLYTLNPHVPHTAVNAAKHSRCHLVIIGYAESDLIKDDRPRNVFHGD